MALPGRFNSEISKSKGKIEAEEFVSNNYAVNSDSLLKSFIDYSSVIVDKPTLESVIYHTENTIKSFDGKFLVNFDTYPSEIQKFINLYVDVTTGYVTYKTQDSDGNKITNEIRISDGVYHNKNTLKNVSGDTLLDIDNLNSDIKKLKDRDIKYVVDSDNNKLIEDADGNKIENVTDTLNRISTNEDDIKKLKDRNIKYVVDSDNNKLIEDADGNKIENVTDTLNRISTNENDITDLKNRNIKYDSDNNEIEDASGDKILSVDRFNTMVGNVIAQVTYDDNGNPTLDTIFDGIDSQPSVSLVNGYAEVSFKNAVIIHKNLIRTFFTVYSKNSDNGALIVNHGDYETDSNGYLTKFKIYVYNLKGENVTTDLEVTFQVICQ